MVVRKGKFSLTAYRRRLGSLLSRDGAVLRRRLADNVRGRSRTLAATMRKTALEKSPTRARLYVFSPYFWSSIIDKGSVAQDRPRRAAVFAWFKDPLRFDPRLNGDYHRTFRRARNARLNLPVEDFRAAVRLGIIRISKKRAAIPPENFVARSMEGLREKQIADIKAEFKQTARTAAGPPATYRLRSRLRDIR